MVKWTVALDEQGKQVNIENAHRFENYTCVNCKESMIVVKGEVYDYHFRHKNITKQCNHDTWLHKNLLSRFMERLSGQDPVLVKGPGEDIDLHDNDSFVNEAKFENWIPDILIRKGEDIMFLEICVTSPCSAEKISSGYKIIEIFTTDARALDELSSGPVLSEGKHYKVEFHNFTRDSEVLPERTHGHIPDIISDESERCTGRKEKDKTVEVPFIPVNRVSGHSSYFIVHSDRSFEVKDHQVACSSDLLLLGINTTADFAMNVGKSYAWRKGILSKEVLTEYETHIDMPAVIQMCNVIEFPIE